MPFHAELAKNLVKQGPQNLPLPDFKFVFRIMHILLQFVKLQ